MGSNEDASGQGLPASCLLGDAGELVGRVMKSTVEPGLLLDRGCLQSVTCEGFPFW